MRFCLNKCCELKLHFLHVWHGIDQTIIDNVIDEWRGRLRACVQAKGRHLEQLLWQCSAIRQETFQFLSYVIRFLDYFLKLPQIWTSNFCKVVRQHTEGMVGSIIWVLLEIYVSFQQWKDFENLLRIGKVIAMSLVYYFLWHSVYLLRQSNRTGCCFGVIKLRIKVENVYDWEN